ncbi:MAG TPA: hypothetical protein VKG21_18210 [Casimicrobiaceae bacterium]|nr:hypothetical protein [Casimicrobiaceae bacterium]
MTTSAVGRVVDEHLAGIPTLVVVLHDIWQQFDVKGAMSNDQTPFLLTYVERPRARTGRGQQSDATRARDDYAVRNRQ